MSSIFGQLFLLLPQCWLLYDLFLEGTGKHSHSLVKYTSILRMSLHRYFNTCKNRRLSNMDSSAGEKGRPGRTYHSNEVSPDRYEDFPLLGWLWLSVGHQNRQMPFMKRLSAHGRVLSHGVLDLVVQSLVGNARIKTLGTAIIRQAMRNSRLL